jgi:Concanavalin A-like lectin/glucanases superfamily
LEHDKCKEYRENVLGPNATKSPGKIFGDEETAGLTMGFRLAVLKLSKEIRKNHSISAPFLGKRLRDMPTKICGSLLVLMLFAALSGPAQTRVLELDGTNSYVELPPNIFNGLTQATVEGWVKWESFGNWSPFFDFGKENLATLVKQVETSPTLGFHLWPSTSGYLRLEVADLVLTNEWCHVADVADKES